MPNEQYCSEPEAERARRVYPDAESIIEAFRPVGLRSALPRFIAEHVGVQSAEQVSGGWSWKFDTAVSAASADTLPELARLACPARLLLAEVDSIVDDSAVAELSARLGHTIAIGVVPESGHHMMFDAPVECWYPRCGTHWCTGDYDRLVRHDGLTGIQIRTSQMEGAMTSLGTESRAEFGKLTDSAIARSRERLGVPRPPRAPTNLEVSWDGSRHFAYGYGDDNPLYCDPEYATGTRWGGLIAPPTFLYTMGEDARRGRYRRRTRRC